jgi:hypothetical protein
VAAKPRTARDVLAVEEAGAWREYLAATSGQPEPRYLEVEPWAWLQLQTRLRAMKTRLAALERKV